MDKLQEMIVLDTLTQKAYSPEEWLMYYKNIWVKVAVARTVDVQTDKTLKAKDPEEMVQDEQSGKIIPVKERLEIRKIGVQDALNIITGINELLANKDGQEGSFESKYWSADALKVDVDMLPSEPKAGDPCQLDNGQGEGQLGDVDGKLICVHKEAVAGEQSSPQAENNTEGQQ